jgi:hypothetical protein
MKIHELSDILKNIIQKRFLTGEEINKTSVTKA